MATPEGNTGYESCMQFATVEHEPWARSTIERYLRNIGATDPNVSELDIESILLCYDTSPANRTYHGPEHGADVGQPEVTDRLYDQITTGYGRDTESSSGLSSETPAVFSREEVASMLALAGLLHDMAHKGVDALPDGTRAWPRPLRLRLREVARQVLSIEDSKFSFTTYPTEAGRSDQLTLMAGRLFGIDIAKGQGIAHKKGGDEFDSALGGGRFLESKGVPMSKIVAIMCMIAGTFPFQNAVSLEDGKIGCGYMDRLADRLMAVTWQDTPDGPARKFSMLEVNAIMAMTVHLANRDTSPFFLKDNFPKIIRDGRLLKAEELASLRSRTVSSIQHLTRVAGLERSTPWLYGQLSRAGEDEQVEISADNVPHFYIPRAPYGGKLALETAYPPYGCYKEAVRQTRRNAELSSLFFTAHEVGICAVASIATLTDESYAPVPGMVCASRWGLIYHAEPTHAELSRLSPDERLIYDELMHGANQVTVDEVTTSRSPVSGFVLGAIGSTGVRRLSTEVQDIRDQAESQEDYEPFARAQHAKRYLKAVVGAIGITNFNIIMRELMAVARFYVDNPKRGEPSREARLHELRVRIVQEMQ